jgi:hypothetical protein
MNVSESGSGNQYSHLFNETLTPPLRSRGPLFLRSLKSCVSVFARLPCDDDDAPDEVGKVFTSSISSSFRLLPF